MLRFRTALSCDMALSETVWGVAKSSPGERYSLSKIPNTQPLNFLGSYSLVGIGKFNLLFLWFIGGESFIPDFNTPYRLEAASPVKEFN